MTASDGETNAEAAEQTDHCPPIDFNTFVLSLGTSAMVHLGVAPNPQTGKTDKSLPMAKQTIDLLGLLEDKTKGNLTGEEERLLGQLLADLRLQYASHCG